MPFSLDPITPANAKEFKSIRLAALLNTPSAFGSTYAKESQLSDAEWVSRAGEWNSRRSAGFLAKGSVSNCGIAAGFLEERDPLQALLISMWVAPAYRRRGVGKLLVDAVAGWARDRGAHTLRLMVTSSNEGAVQFYARNGFSMTGKTEPYPNDPALIEYEMARSLA